MMDFITQSLNLVVIYHELHGYSNALRRIAKSVWEESENIPKFKSFLNVATIGPFKGGKSTLVGRLIYDTNTMEASLKRKIEGLSAEIKNEMEKYAWIIDRTKFERENGHSTDVSRCLAEFKRHYISFINTPGKPNLIKNRICGTMQADSVLLVLDATAWNEVELKTINTLLMTIKSCGCKSVIVAINKMDLILGEDSEKKKRYTDFVEYITGRLNYIGFAQQNTYFVPVSAKTGDNITTNDAFPWYTGGSLADIVNSLNLPQREIHKPLRVIIDRSYSIKSVGTVLTGTVIQGVLNVGQHVKIGPINRIVHVRSLHLAIQKVPTATAYPGQYIGINISGLHKMDFSFKRMGVVTGFLNPLEARKYVFTNKIPKTEIIAKSFGRTPQLDINSEDVITKERKLFRTMEAPLHPVRSFVGRVVLFGVNKGQTIKADGDIVMHSHTGQVIVGIDNMQKFNPKLTKTIVDQSLECEGFSTLALETVLEIFLHLPTFQVFKNIPLVCKLFSQLAYHPSFWNNVVVEQQIPVYDSIDHRTLWQNKNIKPFKERLAKNDSVLMTLHAKGKPFALDTFASCSKLGRFVLRQGSEIVGGGVVVDTQFGGEENEHYWTIT